MNPEERKKAIINLLNENDAISVQDIVLNCGVSDITVRRDLSELEEKGMLLRTHGGAVKTKALPELFSFEERANTYSRQKESICKKASDYINDNDIIFIDCGTTLFRLSQHITQYNNLIVITNSLPIASSLMGFDNINVSVAGGEVDSMRKAIYGPVAEKYISDYHATKAFIGVDGISITNGLSSFNERESAITKKMAENADEVYLLADSSKLDFDAFVKFAPLEMVNIIITDKNVSPDQVKNYADLGIKIITN